MLKYLLILNLLIFSTQSLAAECSVEEELQILKVNDFIVPKSCTINSVKLRGLKYSHARAYGKTELALKFFDSNIWGFNYKYEKVHLYNLHGQHFKALTELKNIDLNAISEPSHSTALSETHLKLGNLNQAESIFIKIDKTHLSQVASLQYMMIHLEILFHNKDYQSLYEHGKAYLSNLIKLKGTSFSGDDAYIFAWYVIGTHMSGQTTENKLNGIKSIREVITITYSKQSVFYKEHERIIGLWK